MNLLEVLTFKGKNLKLTELWTHEEFDFVVSQMDLGSLQITTAFS